MGYVFMVSNCWVCGKPFSFNPVSVPSVRDQKGVKQPVCRGCVERANEMRKGKGLKPFSIREDAYSVCDENEI